MLRNLFRWRLDKFIDKHNFVWTLIALFWNPHKLNQSNENIYFITLVLECLWIFQPTITRTLDRTLKGNWFFLVRLLEMSSAFHSSSSDTFRHVRTFFVFEVNFAVFKLMKQLMKRLSCRFNQIKGVNQKFPQITPTRSKKKCYKISKTLRLCFCQMSKLRIRCFTCDNFSHNLLPEP